MSYTVDTVRKIVIKAFELRRDPLPGEAEVERMATSAHSASDGSVGSLIECLNKEFDALDAQVAA